MFTGRPRWSPPKPEFGTTAAPGYVLDPSGQYVIDPAVLADLERQEARLGVQQGIASSPSAFLESLKQPSSEVIPMNASQWALSSAGRSLQDAPLPLGIGEPMGEFMQSASVGRGTPTGAAMAGLDALNAFPAAWGVKGASAPVKAGMKNLYRQRPGIGETFQGKHYSHAPRDYLDTGFYGSNPKIRSAESSRPGALPSVQFYTPGGVREPGTGVFGHEVELKNVLDLSSKKGMKLKKKARRDVQAEIDNAYAGLGYSGGRASEADVATELERLAFEQGHRGIKSGNVVKSFQDLVPGRKTKVEVDNPTPARIAAYGARRPEGFTIDPASGEVPLGGIVGARRGTEKILPGAGPADIERYLKENTPRPGEYLGGWAENGKTYLDNSQVMGRGDFPRLRGNLNYQRSLYDLDKQKEIPLGLRRSIEDTGPAAGGLRAQMGNIGPKQLPGKRAGVTVPSPKSVLDVMRPQDELLREIEAVTKPNLKGPSGKQGGYIGAVEGSQLGAIGGNRAKSPIISLEPDSRTGARVSTGSPTKIQAENLGFHGRDDLNISLDAMRENPSAFDVNMELMAGYVPTTSRSSTGRAEQATEHIAGNLEYLIDNSPSDFVGRSGNWYKGANALANDLSNSYDVPIEASAGVLARLSPGMDWFQNVEQADRLVSIWSKHKNTVLPGEAFTKLQSLNKGDMSHLKGTKLGDLTNNTDKARWIRAYDEVNNPRSFKGITPEGAMTDIQMTKSGTPKSFMWQSNDNIGRAIGMLEDSSPENISKGLGSGHKIRNFYNNISQPFNPHDVTIDTHAVSAGLMAPYSQKGIPVGHAFGGGAVPGVVRGSAKSGQASGTYGLYADAYRQAAQTEGILPQAMQSPTWELIRENFPFSGHQKDALRQKIDPVWESVKRRKISPREGREQVMDLSTGGQGLSLPEWYGK